MTNDERALRPIEAGPGVLVHPTADRQRATAQWLLSTHRDPRRPRMEWEQHGLALLPLGTLLSAVRLPQRLVLAVTGGTGPSGAVDTALDEILEGGPVICDPDGQRYYALVPASVPETWHEAADEWRSLDVDCLGRGTYLGVPRVDLVAYEPRSRTSSYWAVPMQSAAMLCAPLSVARLIAAGQHLLAEQAGEEGSA
ncbi:hypothetical protein KVH24_23035 [Streptomyces olivaceus]|nr:hypothetical protein [Streptomyces olivaceus]MBZ6181846.1 hypothetical protein [Streptomyces olivaceus]